MELVANRDPAIARLWIPSSSLDSSWRAESCILPAALDPVAEPPVAGATVARACAIRSTAGLADIQLVRVLGAVIVASMPPAGKAKVVGRSRVASVLSGWPWRYKHRARPGPVRPRSKHNSSSYRSLLRSCPLFSRPEVFVLLLVCQICTWPLI